jgi:hypothetical protein
VAGFAGRRVEIEQKAFQAFGQFESCGQETTSISWTRAERSSARRALETGAKMIAQNRRHGPARSVRSRPTPQSTDARQAEQLVSSALPFGAWKP